MNEKRLLIVEDEKPIADILAYGFRKEGFTVQCAHTGAEGLKFFVFLKLPQNLWPRAEVVIMQIHFGVSACFFQFLLQGEDELGLDVRMPETRRHLALLCSFRLVLRRKRGDRYTALLIFFYKPHQIIGIAVDKLLAHAAAAHGAAGFHPAGWTPRRGKYEQIGTHMQNFPDHRNDIFVIAFDREVRKRYIARCIVVGVKLSGIITRSD